jgi:hypothetical protein
MENANQEIASYAFLLEAEVEKHFADVNILLLSGRHIGQKNYTVFTLLEEMEEHWRIFYRNLYNLNLVADQFDSHRYYYLDFFDTGKGKFTENARHRELTGTQTLVGLMFLDIYYKRFFDDQKIVRWAHLRNIILEGEQQESYKKLLFNDVRQSNSYDLKEWSYAMRKLNSAIDLFDKLGWVEKQPSSSNEEPEFEIMPAINRLAKLYEYELQNFEDFVRNIKKEEAL